MSVREVAAVPPATMPWRSPRPWLPGVVLLAVAAAVIVRASDLGFLRSSLAAAGERPALLAIFVAAYSAAFWLRAVAWRLLLDGRISTLRSFSILQTSLFVNHVLPLKAGEVVRPALAARRGVPTVDATATTIVARLLDFACLLALAAMLLPLAAGLDAAATLAVPAIIVTCAGALLLWLRSGRALPAPSRVAPLVAAMADASRSISGRRLLVAAALTLPSWALEASALYVAAEVGGVGLALHAAVAVTAVTILFQVFHFTPGGIGVYEASMTGALALYGVPVEEALAVAVLAHLLKFAYSFSVGLAFAAYEGAGVAGIHGLSALRGSADGERRASRFEIVMARLWNVVNEGKPFTVVFVLGIVLLLSVPRALDAGYWPRAGLALLAIAPLSAIFYRFDFPLKLRIALWAYLAVFVVLVRPTGMLVAGALVLALYFAFTVGLWGSIYYHLRIGTPLTNFTRFWRLVVENPDPTSGNFLEQAPKTLLLVFAFQAVVAEPSWQTAGILEAFALLAGVSAVLLHQWFFTWVPAHPLAPTRVPPALRRTSKRVIAIVIDGCRADRLREARTPFIDRLRAEGTDFTNMRTVYPARTVTCFSSMLTGAPPKVHGMSSNFVPSLGVKCESVFDTFRLAGLCARLVGIAHLIDAFGEDDVRSVTAVTDNDEIDAALASRARQVLREEDPDLLVLQLLSVDQTGHARGSYNREYLEKIEETDRTIEEFLGWCEREGYLDEATVLITADHGQGIGIGGHGHMTPSEIEIPCIMWGHGVERGVVRDDARSIMDVGPTLSHLLGVVPPAQSVGQLLVEEDAATRPEPVAVIIPARNEAENLPRVLRAIPRGAIPGVSVIVVDDGSTDGTPDVARAYGADVVVQHERNRGLGAALRSGLAKACELNARAAVYLDADGEYDASEIPSLLAPVEAGEADYVLGSRYRGSRRGQPLNRLLGNVVFTGLLCVLAGRFITDGQTGFRAFSRRALECAEIIHDYNYAQVLTLDLLRKGMRMREVPVSYERRKRGRSFVRGEYLWRVPLGIAREMLRG